MLVEASSSPSRQRLLGQLRGALPNAKLYSHDSLGLDSGARAASIAFGRPVKPYYKLDQANVVVSLDCDFVGSEEDRHRLIRGFAAKRKLANGSMNRLYSVEGLMTLTGVNADHRLRVPTSQVQGVAALLAAELIKLTPNADASVQALLPALAKLGANINTTTTPAANKISVKPRWIEECAKDLAKPENRGKVAVLAGYRQPAAVHLIAHAINAALGSFGTVVEIGRAHV